MYHARKSPPDAWRTALAAAADLDALGGAVALMRDTLRIDHLVYHWVDAPGGQIAAGTYPAAWCARYAAERFDRLDPVVLAAAHSYGLLNWKDLDWSRQHLRDFLAASAEAGLSSQGLTVPIHGPEGEFALLTANHTCPDDRWTAFARARSDQLILVAHAVHHRARDLLPRVRRGTPVLTRRETDVIRELARGRSRAQAARALRISEHTLRDHLDSLRRKLGARSTTHAVARAVARGLVRP